MLAPLGHIILIPNQPVFVLSPLCCVLSGEATNTNFIVFGWTRSELKPTIYHTRGKHTDHNDATAAYITVNALLDQGQHMSNVLISIDLRSSSKEN